MVVAVQLLIRMSIRPPQPLCGGGSCRSVRSFRPADCGHKE